MMLRPALAAFAVSAMLAAACSGASDSSADAPSLASDAGAPSSSSTFGEGGAAGDAASAPACVETKPPALDPVLGLTAPEYATAYTAYDLGPLPLPDGETDPTLFDPLGACTVAAGDPSTLLFVANSERPEAAIYSVHLERDACGHVMGFDGKSTKRGAVKNADANMIYAPDGTLLVAQYPIAGFAELDPSFATVRQIDLIPLGMDGPVRTSGVDLARGESAGGIAFVPSYLGKKGELRMVAYPSGRWFHAALQAKSKGIGITGLTSTVMLDNGPGGIAWVPPGSPKFTKPGVLVSEWFRGRYTSDTVSPETQRVSAYDVDDEGDPIVSTRRDFFSMFDRPWGAYFEPVAGDFLFLSWLKSPDHIVSVRGFVPPPPPPPLPK